MVVQAPDHNRTSPDHSGSDIERPKDKEDSRRRPCPGMIEMGKNED